MAPREDGLTRPSSATVLAGASGSRLHSTGWIARPPSNRVVVPHRVGAVERAARRRRVRRHRMHGAVESLAAAAIGWAHHWLFEHKVSHIGFDIPIDYRDRG